MEIRPEDEDLHEIETYFDLVDLDQHDGHEDTSLIIKGKESQIKQLQTQLNRAKYFISFLEQENQQLKTKQLIMEVDLLKAKREETKAKALLDESCGKYGDTDELE